jgi:hypothetical protein
LRALPVANLEELFAAGTYSGPKGPAVRASTVADAAKATGVALRAPAKLPAPLQGAPAVYASDPMSFSFTYDGQKLVDLAQKHGVTDPVLLAELRAAHGVTVRGTIPAAALLLYGEPLAAPPAGAAAPAAAKPAARHERTGPFLAYFQMRSPSLDVPKNLNVDRLRELALRSGAVPPQVANQLLAIADWKTTLPVPVTRGSAREVPVDGTTGVLVTGEGPNPALIWLKDGVLNVMSAGSEHDLLEAARALAPAR